MQTFTLSHNGRVFANATLDDLRARGIPEAVLDEAARESRRAQVSAECRRRIYAAASAETQMNMATAASVISGKETPERTAEEQAILEGVRAALDWVNDMRAQVPVLTDDPDADLTADANWPDLPLEVAATVEQF